MRGIPSCVQKQRATQSPKEVTRCRRVFQLSKARLKRVRSRPVWGLLVWSSSPLWHTASASAAAAASQAPSRPSSPPPMPMAVHSGAASRPFCPRAVTSDPARLALERLAITKTREQASRCSSASAVTSKSSPTCTASMPGGIGPVGADAMFVVTYACSGRVEVARASLQAAPQRGAELTILGHLWPAR